MPGKRTIDVVRTVGDLRARIGDWRGHGHGHGVGLVPTMGALHEGHLSLVRQSLTETDRTCVTLFVNPRQFGPGEDLATYPRDEASDMEKLSALGVHLLFAPAAEEMYPPGAVTRVSVPGLGDELEGAHRPDFFTGVATVVAKLLLQAMPDAAFFGEKDYQQFLVIRRMAADLDIPVTIRSGPTVREADGLALSSRNGYLTPGERAIAPALHRSLTQVAEEVEAGGDPIVTCKEAVRRILEAGFQKVDYVEVRDAATFAPVADASQPARVLAAAWLGRARLIDNIAV